MSVVLLSLYLFVLPFFGFFRATDFFNAVCRQHHNLLSNPSLRQTDRYLFTAKIQKAKNRHNKQQQTRGIYLQYSRYPSEEKQRYNNCISQVLFLKMTVDIDKMCHVCLEQTPKGVTLKKCSRCCTQNPAKYCNRDCQRLGNP